MIRHPPLEVIFYLTIDNFSKLYNTNSYDVRGDALCDIENKAKEVLHIDGFDSDLIGSILSFLNWKEIFNIRCVCKKIRDVAALTPIKANLVINDQELGHDLSWISLALPRVESVVIDFSSADSESFLIERGGTYNMAIRPIFDWNKLPNPVKLDPIKNLVFLRHLRLTYTNLNGSYPYLFNFRNLETLHLTGNECLQWDLEMLSGLPNLKIMNCERNLRLTGNLKSVRFVRNIVELNLNDCVNVSGFLDSIFGLSKLEVLKLEGTKVSGDIRRIGAHNLVSLKKVAFGDRIYGGGAVIRQVRDASFVMMARHHLLKQFPDIFIRKCWQLDMDSPERYLVQDHHSHDPPFWVEFVKAGPRFGWRWTNRKKGGSCEIHWIDPEPQISDECYDIYCRERDIINLDVGFFHGFFCPPTEEQYEDRSVDIVLDPILEELRRNLELQV